MNKRHIFFLLVCLAACILIWNQGEGDLVHPEDARPSPLVESAVPSGSVKEDLNRVSAQSNDAWRIQLVSSYSGAPLPQGLLLGHPSGPLQANERGEIEIAMVADFKGTYSAECAGYFPSEVEVELLEPDRVIRLELDPNYRIHGQVIDLVGQPVSAGLLVVAFHAIRPTASEFYEMGRGAAAPSARYSFGLTNSNGEFEIERLDPAVSYSLVAGGEGLISPNSRNNVAPTLGGGERVVVEVAHTWGVQFILTAADGQPLRGSGRLFQGFRAMAARIEGAHGAHPLPNLPWMTMLGIPPSDLVSALPTVKKDRHLYFGKPLNQNPTILYTWTAPGYEDNVTTAELEPVIRGIKEVHLFALPDPRGFGSFELEVVGSLLDEVTGGSSSSPDLLVELFPIDEPYRSEDLLYRMAIPRASDGVYVVDGVPHGSYNVGFRSRNKLWSRSPELQTVRVAAGREAVRLDLSALGAAQVDVLDEDGFEIELNVRTRFHQWGREDGHHAFEYIRPGKETISMLPPGEYRFYPERPFPKGYEPLDSDGAVVRVDAGEIAIVNLAFRKTRG